MLHGRPCVHGRRGHHVALGEHALHLFAEQRGRAAGTEAAVEEDRAHATGLSLQQREVVAVHEGAAHICERLFDDLEASLHAQEPYVVGRRAVWGVRWRGGSLFGAEKREAPAHSGRCVREGADSEREREHDGTQSQHWQGASAALIRPGAAKGFIAQSGGVGAQCVPGSRVRCRRRRAARAWC